MFTLTFKYNNITGTKLGGLAAKRTMNEYVHEQKIITVNSYAPPKVFIIFNGLLNWPSQPTHSLISKLAYGICQMIFSFCQEYL